MATYPFPGRIRPRPEIRPPRCRRPEGCPAAEGLARSRPAGAETRGGPAEKEAPAGLGFRCHRGYPGGYRTGRPPGRPPPRPGVVPGILGGIPSIRKNHSRRRLRRVKRFRRPMPRPRCAWPAAWPHSAIVNERECKTGSGFRGTHWARTPLDGEGPGNGKNFHDVDVRSRPQRISRGARARATTGRPGPPTVRRCRPKPGVLGGRAPMRSRRPRPRRRCGWKERAREDRGRTLRGRP